MLLSDLPTYILPAHSICSLLLSTFNMAARVIPIKVKLDPLCHSSTQNLQRLPVSLSKSQLFHGTSALHDLIPHCLHILPTISPSFTLIQPQWLPCWFTNMPGTLLLQSLCTHCLCYHCLGNSREKYGLLPHFLQTLFQKVSKDLPRKALLGHSICNSTPAPPCPSRLLLYFFSLAPIYI